MKDNYVIDKETGEMIPATDAIKLYYNDPKNKGGAWTDRYTVTNEEVDGTEIAPPDFTNVFNNQTAKKTVVKKPSITKAHGSIDEPYIKVGDVVELKEEAFDKNIDASLYYMVSESKNGKLKVVPYIHAGEYGSDDERFDLGDEITVDKDLIYDKASYSNEDFFTHSPSEMRDTNAYASYMTKELKKEAGYDRESIMQDVYNRLKNMTIRPLRHYKNGEATTIKDESLNDARKSLLGVVKVKNDPNVMTLNEQYDELREQFPSVFPDVDNDEDQFLALADVLREAKEYKPIKPRKKRERKLATNKPKVEMITWKQGAMFNKKTNKLVPLWVIIKKEKGKKWNGDYSVLVPDGRENDTGRPFSAKDSVEFTTSNVPDDIKVALGMWNVNIDDGKPYYMRRSKMPNNATLVKNAK